MLAKIPRRHLPPSPFPLDRLLAILRAILPRPPAPGGADVLARLATLSALRLVVRAGAGAGDVLDAAAARWRVNVGWEYVVGVARGVGFEVGEFLVE